MNAFVHMTGPHPSRLWRGGHAASVWNVAIVNPEQEPLGKVYRCLSYRRAVRLSCNIARDRRLFLQIHALPG